MYLRVEDGRLVGVMPSLEDPVSKGRLCDLGWHAHEHVGSPGRLRKPLVRRGGRLEEAEWEEGLSLAASGLRKVIEGHGPDSVGVLGSGCCTNETNFLAAKFARAAIGTNNVDFSGRLAQLATFSRWADAGGRRGKIAAPLSQLREADVILLCEGDLATQQPVVASYMLEALEGEADKRMEVHSLDVAQRVFGRKDKVAQLIVVSLGGSKMGRLASVLFQPKPGKDAIWVKGMVRGVCEALGSGTGAGFAQEVEGHTPELVERETGVPAGMLLEAARIFASAERPCIVYSPALSRRTGGGEAVVWLGKLALLKGASVWGVTERCNVQGACDAGVMPETLAGYQAVSDGEATRKFEAKWGARVPRGRGMSAWEMVGSAKGMLIVGDDPIRVLPDSVGARRALEGLEFLVVQESFLTETARLAHVVLPAASFGEEEGTYTSSDGRVQRARRAVQPAGTARAHWEILCELAAGMGYRMGYSSAEEVMAEMASLSPLYEGMTYDRLGPGGAVAGQIEGEGLAGLGLPSEAGRTLAEGADEEFPLLLVVDDSRYEWQGDVLVENSPTLAREYGIPMKNFPGGFVEANPRDLEKVGVRRGARVKIISRRGEMVVQAAPTADVPEGTVLLPLFLREMAGAAVATSDGEGYPTFAPCPVRIERQG